MWSPYYWYFEIRGKYNYTVKLPTSQVVAMLDAKPWLQKGGHQSYENVDTDPWMTLSCIYSEDGNFGSHSSLNNEWCTLITIVGSKNFPNNLEYYQKSLAEIASDLNWELIWEEDDDGNQNVVLWPMK